MRSLHHYMGGLKEEVAVVLGGFTSLMFYTSLPTITSSTAPIPPKTSEVALRNEPRQLNGVNRRNVFMYLTPPHPVRVGAAIACCCHSECDSRMDTEGKSLVRFLALPYLEKKKRKSNVHGGRKTTRNNGIHQ